ncbi:MAG TPA: aldehyde dehydrogenase family protein [bacterium]|nr:aldehyde dehydrogenase family protein [bacterium]
MKIVNPANGETLRLLVADEVATIEAKYRSLREGQKAWAARPLKERIGLLDAFGGLLGRNKEELAKTLSLEIGKPIRESRNEIDGAMGRVRYFVENSEKWLSPETVNESPGVQVTREVLAFEPLGVIANISAWNYPYLIAMNVIVPALIAGNAVLYKPSEFSTLTGQYIQHLLFKAGVPEDAFQAVIGAAAAGQALLKLPLDGFFFTGSYKIGRSIAQSLAGRMIPVVLELGGKDPLYVADDVDVEKAAAMAAEGAFYNAGQSCCAVERIYVHEKIHDAFLEALVAETRKLKLGDPLEEATTLGPVTREAHLKVLEGQVWDAVARGAALKTGGHAMDVPGNFFEPTVLAEVDHTMSVMKEETFGPVIGIQKVKDDEEALRLMADTEYGLTAAVFSKSEERAKAILEKLDVGTGYWNCYDRVSPWLPWSGRRNSGMGTTLSYLGIHAFVKTKGYHLRA